MEGHDGLNTLECLRGRLLAERQASRVAKEEAQSMGNKFVELEKKLREEIMLRDKAERKLKLLKLESFKMLSPSRHPYLSEECEKSCRSSSCSTDSTHSEANETKLHRVSPALLENHVYDHNVGEASVLIQTHNSPFTTTHCGSQLNGAPTQSSENVKNDENRLSSKSLAKGYDSQDNDD